MALLSKSMTWVSSKKDLEKNARVEDLLPFPLEEEFSKSSPYSELQDFGGPKFDEDNIDETKNCGDVDSIINNVISSVFTASSSLPTSPDVKNTQAERSDLGGINNDTTNVISDIDATTKFVNADSTTCVIEISLGKYMYRIGYSKISKELWKKLNVDLSEVSINHDVLFILSQCLDTILYYMRKKVKYEPNIVVKFTTIDFVLRINVPWEKSELGHWILGVFDFTDWCIYVYDSNRTSDCGAFVCAFAEYVIHSRDIPKEIDIGHVRMRYGALRWDYGKRKLEAGIKDNTMKKVGRLFGKEKRMRTHRE
ncbi:hypothetical protein CQW23_31090 [Capsicum baccatum]|uniref:Ubiquitin-like protease family profile domain-containing protein n=1 Tax=Capsicum baccatum TaxID=33114 RepID=A0A2G2V8Q6_CAPBA|nr:hypothetical protein CQW23_31090 [Capsicum baccatum]